MWPFTGKRIFGNRWWALAFAAYVCWQAAEVAGSASDTGNSAGNSAQAQSVEDALANIG